MKIAQVSNVVTYKGSCRKQAKNNSNDRIPTTVEITQDTNSPKARMHKENLKKFFDILLNLIPWKKDKEDEYIELDKNLDIINTIESLDTIEDKNIGITKHNSKTDKQNTVKPQTTAKKPSFPTPDFKDNPTKIQKFEYIESIKKYLETSDKELNLKAIEAVGKYGAGEQADKLIYFATADDDELVQAAEKAYKNLGDSARLYEAFSPIQGVVPYNDETYIVTLDTINALINPKTDKEDLKFISKIIKEKLLNHKSDKVRNLAQTLFDKLNSMI